MAKVVALVDRDAREGTVPRSACALLTLARRLGEPVAACATMPDAAAIRTLGRYGATEIWCPQARSEPAAVIPHQARSAESVSPATDTDLLAAVAWRLEPAAILIPATPEARKPPPAWRSASTPASSPTPSTSVPAR